MIWWRDGFRCHKHILRSACSHVCIRNGCKTLSIIYERGWIEITMVADNWATYSIFIVSTFSLVNHGSLVSFIADVDFPFPVVCDIFLCIATFFLVYLKLPATWQDNGWPHWSIWMINACLNSCKTGNRYFFQIIIFFQTSAIVRIAYTFAPWHQRLRRQMFRILFYVIMIYCIHICLITTVWLRSTMYVTSARSFAYVVRTGKLVIPTHIPMNHT